MRIVFKFLELVFLWFEEATESAFVSYKPHVFQEILTTAERL